MNENFIFAQAINKSYPAFENKKSGESLTVLKDLNLQVKRGESLAIVGSSGSGKSTLLHILAGLDQATSGKITYDGQDLQQLNDKQMCQFRNKSFGFIFQFHHLLPELSALENVALALRISGESIKNANLKAEHALVAVGLQHRLLHRPGELSGGERQRTALARAIVNSPQCIFADEPTGNLDQSTARNIFKLLLSLTKEHNSSLVVVTHDLALAAETDRILELHDYQLRPFQIIETA